jgi:hypothetical protein
MKCYMLLATSRLLDLGMWLDVCESDGPGISIAAPYWDQVEPRHKHHALSKLLGPVRPIENVPTIDSAIEITT